MNASGFLMVSDDTAGSHGLVEVEGDGSSISVASSSVIGDVGFGTLNVINGGTYSVSETLDVSGSGTGVLLIDGQGNSNTSVTVTGPVAVGRSNGSVGILTLRSSGQLFAEDLISVSRLGLRA